MINKIMLAMLMAAAAFGASAGNPEKLFDEFKKVENTEYVRVRRAFLWAFRATGMLKEVPAVGNYLTLTGKADRIDPVFRTLQVGDTVVPFEDLVEVSGEGIMDIDAYLGIGEE